MVFDGKGLLGPLGISLCLVSMAPAQFVTAPLLVQKDGDITMSHNEGEDKDLFVNGDRYDRRWHKRSVGWIVFHSSVVDLSYASKAILSLNLAALHNSGTLKIYSLSSPATKLEDKACWGDFQYDDNKPVASMAINSSMVDMIVNLDVTAAVKRTPFHGLALVAEDGLSAYFSARESGMPPMIQLQYPALSGPQGPKGDQGPAGPRGIEGLMGATGPMGPEGKVGATGPMGPQGPEGKIGATGPMGPQGPEGKIGAIGPMGPEGKIGAVGPMGPQGPEGQAGAVGPMGPMGPEGQAGAVGPMGPMGPEGMTGATGPMGPQGPEGKTGEMGPQGPIGETGAMGPEGAIGPQGPEGQAGAVGPMGPMGPAGADGQIGPQGIPGEPGPIGLTGATGPAGPAGPQGPPGTSGGQGSWIEKNDTVSTTDRVGIGTTRPLAKLHVDGTTILNGATTITGSTTVNGNANISGTIRGASWGFGGLYSVDDCAVNNTVNPLTNALSCPAGFTAHHFLRYRAPESNCGANSFVCIK